MRAEDRKKWLETVLTAKVIAELTPEAHIDAESGDNMTPPHAVAIEQAQVGRVKI